MLSQGYFGFEALIGNKVTVSTIAMLTAVPPHTSPLPGADVEWLVAKSAINSPFKRKPAKLVSSLIRQYAQ
jgi:hypothetical protein